MIREIKFRAYYKDKGKVDIVTEVGFDYDGNLEYVTHFGETYLDLDMVELMQYTGLKDKSGKEIYEGDVVYRNLNKGFEIEHEGDTYTAYKKQLDKNPCVVEFVNGSFRLNNPNDYSKNYYGVIDYSTSTYSHDLEVVGNIHENPELLND